MNLLPQFTQSFAFFIVGFAAVQLLFNNNNYRHDGELTRDSYDREQNKLTDRPKNQNLSPDESSAPKTNAVKRKDGHQNHRSVGELLRKSVRILCLVLSTEFYHEYRARFAARTWGRRCTKIIFVSDAYDPGLPSRNFSLGEKYNTWSHVWSKVRPAFEWAHTEFYESNEFDWFFKGDDDTFAFLENMRFFLAHYDPNKPWFFGRHFYNETWEDPQNFPMGGSGYILSRKALDVVIKKSFTHTNHCSERSKAVSEDVELGRCVEAAGIPISDSRDRIGRQRFMFEAPWDHLTPGQIPKSTTIITWDKYPYVDGEECCSDVAMTFHYVPAKYQPTIEYLVYRLKVAGVDADFHLANLQ